MVAEEQQDSVAPENHEAATTVKFLFAGIIFVINGFFADWILGSESNVGDFSAWSGHLF